MRRFTLIVMAPDSQVLGTIPDATIIPRRGEYIFADEIDRIIGEVLKVTIDYTDNSVYVVVKDH